MFRRKREGTEANLRVRNELSELAASPPGQEQRRRRWEVLFKLSKSEYSAFLSGLERVTGKKAVDTSQIHSGSEPSIPTENRRVPGCFLLVLTAQSRNRSGWCQI